MLIDKHNRVMDYLRLAVTDRCNLRCHYCMPEEGIRYVERSHLLTYEEILRLVSILIQLGIRKVRITGGEPFLRKNLMELLRKLSAFQCLEIAITTNGTLVSKHIDELISLGISKYNLSLDSLDRKRFAQITRRDCFDEVYAFLMQLIDHPDTSVKINMVVMDKHNIADIDAMMDLIRYNKVSVRFIEEMPFNGSGVVKTLTWDYRKILAYIERKWGAVVKMPDPYGSTSLNYKIQGWVGSFGIIPAFSRTICHACNRLRITPEGKLKTCLYDQGVFSLRDLIRSGASDEQLGEALRDAVHHKAKDGFVAEDQRLTMIGESMATIGG